MALSSAEAEFKGIAQGLAEVLLLRKILAETSFPVKGACSLMCYNYATISILENSVQHD